MSERRAGAAESDAAALPGDLDSTQFRFVTKRDALPTLFIHFAISSSDQAAVKLDRPMMLSLLSPHGRVLGLTIRHGARSGYAHYEFGHQAAHALNALGGKPLPGADGVKLLVTFAAVRAPSTRAINNADTHTISPLLSHIRLWSRLLTEPQVTSLSMLDRMAHKSEVNFGTPLEDEDDKFGLPAPKPLTADTAATLSDIAATAASYSESIADASEQVGSASTESNLPAVYRPSSVTVAEPVPLFNRLTIHTLQPGAGVRPSVHDDDQFDGSFALLALRSGVYIDVYQSPNTDHTHTSIYLPVNGMLYLPAAIAGQFAFGVAFRTRDFIDGKRYKRSKVTLVRLTRVRAADEFDSEALSKRRVRQLERERQRAEREDRRLVSMSLPSELQSLSSEMLERLHVHRVYDTIAAHFSSTRHSPWPRVEAYVKALPAGLSIVDVACGNGKYMGLNPSIKMTGCDISEPLVKICQSKGYHALVADCMALPFGDNVFDGCISIALLHHISSEDRRIQALSEMLRVVKPAGRMLVTAWALEQDETSRRKFASQDVLVPWRLPSRFRQRPSQSDTDQATKPSDSDNSHGVSSEYQQRYCHVYIEGEIEGLLARIGGNRVVDRYYDRGNWCVMFEKSGDSSAH